MQFDRSPAEVWRRYERDRDYKRSIGLYDRVRRNEAFYLGRQWEGLRVQSLDPLIFNVLRRCVNLFVAMLVSDDVAVRVTPFEMNGEGRRTAHVLERAFASAIERSGVKALGRPLLKNACVDGDACFYVHFDPALETGQAVKGDIAVDLIDSTNICFGNPACDEVQRQPYIIIAMRRDVDEVRREARENGISEDEISAIRADDAGEYHRWRVNGGEERVTVLLHMRRVEGGIAFCKTVRNATVMREKVLPYRLYPVTHLCWNRVRGSCHGESPLTEAIPNQIAINKLYSMYVQCIKQVAFPKIVYDMTRFPNGWSNDVGKAIAMRGNPNEAIAAAFRAPDISAQVLQLLRQMMTDTTELMGASEASLGTVRPDNTSAIIAVQSATAAPLELTKMEFYRFTEDWARIFLDMMGVHYGVRTASRTGRALTSLPSPDRICAFRWMSARQATGPRSCRPRPATICSKAASSPTRSFISRTCPIIRYAANTTCCTRSACSDRPRRRKQQMQEPNNRNPENTMPLDPFAAAEAPVQSAETTYPVEADGEIHELTLDELIEAAAQGLSRHNAYVRRNRAANALPNGQIYAAFVEEYPDVRPEDIPQQVWEWAQQEGSLVSAYRKWEIAELRDELAALEMNRRNRRAAVGTAQTDGEPAGIDPVTLALLGR